MKTAYFGEPSGKIAFHQSSGTGRQATILPEATLDAFVTESG